MEAFAEAFAFYYTDNEKLRALRPTIAEFFDKHFGMDNNAWKGFGAKAPEDLEEKEVENLELNLLNEKNKEEK